MIEKLPFDIKRIFYIYGVDNSVRGGHKHKKTIQAAVCLQGFCAIKCNDFYFSMYRASKCLIIRPEDYHEMFNFSMDCILMVLCSEEYDPDDYIYPPCANDKCICYREHYHKNNCSWFVVYADNTVGTLGTPKCSEYIPGKMEETTKLINQRDFR